MLSNLFYPHMPNHVCKVNKALYGLKQTPRAWYETLILLLMEQGLRRGRVDTTLFIRKHRESTLIVQIYVDDINFGSADEKFCDRFANLMQNKFEISMIRELTFFLGFQIKQSTKGIFINQSKYVTDLLKKYDMESSTKMNTLMSTAT